MTKVNWKTAVPLMTGRMAGGLARTHPPFDVVGRMKTKAHLSLTGAHIAGDGAPL